LGKKKPAGNVSGGLCFSRHGLSGFWTRPTDLVKKQFPFEGYRGAMRSMSRRPASPFAPPCRKACHPGRKLELRLYVWHRRDEFPNRAPYYDFRHLELFGPIIQPAGITAQEGLRHLLPGTRSRWVIPEGREKIRRAAWCIASRKAKADRIRLLSRRGLFRQPALPQRYPSGHLADADGGKVSLRCFRGCRGWKGCRDIQF